MYLTTYKNYFNCGEFAINKKLNPKEKYEKNHHQKITNFYIESQ